MKINLIKTIILVMLTALYFNSCNLINFSRNTSSRWKNDVAYQTIRWNTNSTETDVEYEFRIFVHETLTKNRYKNYVQLFQSNYLLNESERTYVIKIFKNEEAKNNYLNNADDMIRMSTALASNSFNERWHQLQPKMIVEDIYNLLPELANFKAKQVFYTNRSELSLGDRWLSFDLQGHLLSFGIGNTSTRTSTKRTSEEWVF
ncbi:MAG: hypothetical protein Q4G63_08075 [Bacteroidia bacterium]|nr:hypothetical protein [Bacteroidia bacterium]